MHLYICKSSKTPGQEKLEIENEFNIPPVCYLSPFSLRLPPVPFAPLTRSRPFRFQHLNHPHPCHPYQHHYHPLTVFHSTTKRTMVTPSLTERGAEARLPSLSAAGIALPGKSEPDKPPRFSPPKFSPSPGEPQKATKFSPPTKSSEPLGESEKAPGQPSRSAQYREPCQRDQQRSERGLKV